MEIWGFVLAFVFRTWLSGQKFSYKGLLLYCTLSICLFKKRTFSFAFFFVFAGGMTEEKKVLRRKVLAKWLKENILRLGPTFIKIGQQFSTRVDILPQEYVDQLSELQVCFLV